SGPSVHRSTGERRHRRDQRVRLQWLLETELEARLEGARLVLLAGVRRDRDGGQLAEARRRADLAEEHMPGGLRETDVAPQDVELPGPQYRARLLDRTRDADTGAELLEERAHQIARVLVVLDDEDPDAVEADVGGGSREQRDLTGEPARIQ